MVRKAKIGPPERNLPVKLPSRSSKYWMNLPLPEFDFFCGETPVNDTLNTFLIDFPGAPIHLFTQITLTHVTSKIEKVFRFSKFRLFYADPWYKKAF